MQTDPVTVGPDLSVAELVDLLEERDINGVPVVGIVTSMDVVRAVATGAGGRR